jgi:hypothetical protein
MLGPHNRLKLSQQTEQLLASENKSERVNATHIGKNFQLLFTQLQFESTSLFSPTA